MSGSRLAREFINQYEVLGIPKTASRERIVAAHRQIALENAAGQLGLGDAAELRLKAANAAKTVLLRDRVRHDRELARHEARLASTRTAGVAKTGFQGGAVPYRRRPRPQPAPRPAHRVFDRIGLQGLHKANQTTATQAASSAQGRRSGAVSSRVGPQLRPTFLYGCRF